MKSKHGGCSAKAGSKFALSGVLLMAFVTLILMVGVVELSFAAPTEEAKSANEGAEIDFRDGQYFIIGATYTAIIPPTGLISLLETGKKVVLDVPPAVCIGSEWNPESRKEVFPSIERSEPNVLTCIGPKGKLQYRFEKEAITMTLTANAESLRLFFRLAKSLEAIWTEGKFLGSFLHVAGGKTGDFAVRSLEGLASGNLLKVTNMTVFYGPDLLRLDVPANQAASTDWRMGPALAGDRGKFEKKAPEDGALAILSPKDFQVFQRQSAASGSVFVAGRISVPCDMIEVRCGDSRQVVSVDQVTGDFAGRLEIPAGGWYSFEMVAKEDGQEVATKKIDHVGVGEVFVSAGQSNSTNNGETPLKTESRMVSTFDGESWRLADDPQPGAFDNTRGGSFYPSLGDLLYEKLKVPIAFSVTGMGGSSVSEWHAGGSLFAWMQDRIERIGLLGFRAVLWHQGEADASTTADDYYRSLKEIIEQSNIRAGWTFPWMVAQVGGVRTREAKERLWADRIALKGPDSDTLIGPENRFKNGAHFTEVGLRRHAELWFQALSDYLDKVYPPAQKGPESGL